MKKRILFAMVLLGGLARSPAQTLLVDDFNAGTATGSVVPGSTWDGGVTQNADSITVAGEALDENGWQAPAVNLDATGMNVITITARRDSGNQAPSLALQFEDPNLNTTVFSVSTSQFAVGEFTTVYLQISAWSAGFDFTQIMGWNFGGGSPGILPFRLTIDEILLQSEIAAAPEVTSAGGTETVTEGASVTFTVTATGASPLVYQWFKDSVAITGNASAATAALTLTGVAPTAAGAYTCRVTNTLGHATSPAFTLVVRPLATVVLSDLTPTYTGQPRVVTVDTTPAGLAVTVTYDEETSPPVNAGSYAVEATVVDDEYVGSATGTLVVAKRVPVITWNPGEGALLNDGDPLTPAHLDATAETAGTFVFDPVVGTPLAMGEHTLTAVFTPTDLANNLPVTVTRLLAVGLAPPTVLTPPSDRSVLTGQEVSFTVSAAGSGTLLYEWTKDGEVLAGATTTTLLLTAVAPDAAGEYSVRVYNAAGSAPIQTAQLTVFDVVFSQAVDGGGYRPGESVTIVNTVTHAGSLTLAPLTWSVLPPAAVEGVNWTFVSSTGDDAAETRPAAHQAELLEWNWPTLPASPFTFSYTLAAPAAATGIHELTAMVDVTVNGMEFEVLVAPEPLDLAPAVTHHSADTDGDFQLSLSELLRVIELYNTRFGTSRTGRYRSSTASADGFESDPTLGSGQATTLTAFHSADVDRDGLLSLSELLRVIELYNHREGTTRTGRYHGDATSADGFAPGA